MNPEKTDGLPEEMTEMTEMRDENTLWQPMRVMRAMMQAFSLYLLYLGLSFLDPWGYFPDFLHLGLYILVFLGVAFLLFRALRAQPVLHSPVLKTPVRLMLLTSALTLILAIMAGDDLQRRLEIATAPRALFSYADPVITVSVIPPAYSGFEKNSAIVSLQDPNLSALNPVAQGSEIKVNVKNLRWPSRLILGSVEKILEKTGKDEYETRLVLGDAVEGQLRQGSKILARWPIIQRADEDPKIKALSYKPVGELLALSLDVADDYRIERAHISLSPAGADDDGIEGTEEIFDLPLREVKNFKDDIILDLRSSAYAGQNVDLMLILEDQAGQKTTSELKNISLNHRQFKDPDALALWQTRKAVSEHPEDRKKLARRAMALGLVADQRASAVVYHMALRSIYWRLSDPSSEADIKSARDLLWDLALLREEGEYARIGADLFAAMHEISLALHQRKPLNDIRLKLVDLDRLFYTYIRSAIHENQMEFTEDIDVHALRKLYGRMLAHIHKDRYDQASLLVSYMKNGLGARDGMMLSGKGYVRFMAAQHGRKILGNLIDIQKQLLARSYQESVQMELASADPDGKIARQKTRNLTLWVKAQKNMMTSFMTLGEKLKDSGMREDGLLDKVETLVQEAVINMETGEMESAAQNQTEILGALNDLKSILEGVYEQGEEMNMRALTP